MKRKIPATVGNKRLTPEEKELNEAIDRVYRKYGTDLTAFFDDIYKELPRKPQEGRGTRDSSK